MKLNDRDELDELLEKMQREEKAQANRQAKANSALALPPAPPSASASPSQATSSSQCRKLTPEEIAKRRVPRERRGVQSKGAALNRLLVRATLNKQGRAKGIREIAEHCGLTIGQTRRSLKRLIDDRLARQIGRGAGTKYLARDYGPIKSTNPAQIKPGQKGPQPLPPMTGEGSGRGRRTQPLTDEERKKAMAMADEIMDAFKRQSRNRQR